MSGEPLDPVELVPVTDETGQFTILVPSDMKFADGKATVERITYRGKVIFICRSAVYEGD
ncbi:MAG: hypothetical protein GX181_06485 [Synergistaceae bacterium]|nr:hypothetical protein [Synergistota bacterium]NLM71588.1 hypothetical protein [Synergistaceae bacterium]